MGSEVSAAAWRAWWQEAAPGLAERLADRAPIDDTPAYPLARTVPMPEELEFRTGALSFRMHGVVVEGMAGLAAGSGDRLGRLGPAHVQISGRYTIEAKPDPVMEIDGGGNLMELPSGAFRPTSAGSDGDDGGDLTPTQEEWLDNARLQRDRLLQTENGTTLVNAYYGHNETFNAAFEPANAAITGLTTQWKNGGATTDMAAHTNETTHPAAGNEDVPVNDPSIRYVNQDTGAEFTYNGASFVQQLFLAGVLKLLPDVDSTVTSEDADAAAAAMIGFGKKVHQTGNTKDDIHPMTSEDVYAAVEQDSGEVPHVSAEELSQFTAEGPTAAGAALLAADPTALVLDEEERAMIRRLHETTMRNLAQRADFAGQPLFEGRCGAVISGVEVTLSPAARPDGRIVPEVRAHLPAFQLDIEDEHWSGEAGRVARQRLENVHFIRSLFHDAVARAIEEAVRDALVDDRDTGGHAS